MKNSKPSCPASTQESVRGSEEPLERCWNCRKQIRNVRYVLKEFPQPHPKLCSTQCVKRYRALHGGNCDW